MKSLSEIQNWLEVHKPILGKRYKIKALGIFGSYSRQEQTENSGLDILVEFSEVPSLLEFINLGNYLTDNLGVKAEGVTERLKSMLYKVYGSNAFKVK